MDLEGSEFVRLRLGVEPRGQDAHDDQGGGDKGGVPAHGERIIVLDVKRAGLAVVTALAFGLQSAWVLYSQTAKPPGPLTTARVTGDLHMVSGEGGNVALYVTGEGVVLVDDMFDRNHDDILKQVKAVTSQPLRYVFNTHQHDDHAGGDAKMLRIAEVIAHKNVRANLLDIKQPYFEDTPGTPIGLPRLTFSDEMTLNLGASEVRALYFGRGHTRGDAIIHFPRERVIHTGDLFLNFPARPRPDGSPRPPGVLRCMWTRRRAAASSSGRGRWNARWRWTSTP